MRGCACHTTEGFVHVSCLAEQAKILVAEAEENNWDDNRFIPRWRRWLKCSLCEQDYHGVVRCALGWACWKTYLYRPETDNSRRCAMTDLGNGLYAAGHHEDELIVREAELSTLRRIGAPENCLLAAQGNLASTHQLLRRANEALPLQRAVYSGRLKLLGGEDEQTLAAAVNYAGSLICLKRFEEARSLLRETLPAARRVLREGHRVTLIMRNIYAKTLYKDASATLDDLREAVTTLEETAQTARRVLGPANPTTTTIGRSLRDARAALNARVRSAAVDALMGDFPDAVVI